MSQDLHIVILAAGQGTRMASHLPKVLHPVAGVPMLKRVIDTAAALCPQKIHVIIGHQAERIKDSFAHAPVHWVEQKAQRGTGDAIAHALPFIPQTALVLILSADVPLLQMETLQTLLSTYNKLGKGLGLLVAHLPDPTGLGRVLRNAANNIVAIVEEKDANIAQKAIQEIYSGICCTQASHLRLWLPKLTNNNAQGEYYLTDIIRLCTQEDLPIVSIEAHDIMEVQGVNDRLQLHLVERAWQKRFATQLLIKGTSLADLNRLDVRGELFCEKDVFIDINCVFTGTVHLGAHCHIGPNCQLTNVTLGQGCTLLANSVLTDCTIEEHCNIGPFAHIRPGTHLEPHCKIGNFVEIKKTHFGAHSKANHLSYLGDTTLGKAVNIGAGTITCNYDGANKHPTKIDDGAFIGSGTQLVAPIHIGAHATIGAGSTIRRDAPSQELTLTEAKQKTISGWKRPAKRG